MWVVERKALAMFLWLPGWLLVSGCLAHSGGQRGEPVVHITEPKATPFPSRQDLTKLETAAVPSRIAQPDVYEAERWDLTDPPAHPDNTLAHPPSSAWERLLADAVAKRAGLLFLPESMSCVARQLGQFYLANKAMPDDPLLRFISSR